MATRTTWLALCLYALVLLVQLAFAVGIIWIIWHFVAKYW